MTDSARRSLAWTRTQLLRLGVLGILGTLSVTGVPGCEKGAASQVPADAARTVVSLRQIDCQSCGGEVAEAMTKAAGIYEASFDKDKAEVHVAYDASQIDGPAIVAIATGLGHDAVEGAGQGVYTPLVDFPEDMDVVQVSKAGEAAELAPHIAVGKVTVFDFHAQWCGPCKKVDRHMLDKMQRRDDIALRKLDIVDWDSPVAKQYLGNVPDLPYLIIYGTKGKEVARISGFHLEEIDAAIDKAAGK